MAESLFFYKLVSPYYDESGKPIDVTKNCKLSIGEIDSNFLTLKDYDISAATFVRGEDKEKSDGTLVLTRNNGEKIIVPIDTTRDNVTYDFIASEGTGDKGGTTLSITYKDDEGEHSLVINDILTADNLIDIIGSDILTKVISDDTLRGLGTMKSPLGIAGIEKTGMLAPAIKVVDLTDGSILPSIAKKGTRYVTKEKVNDYGYLYNGSGVNKIQEILDREYEENEIYKEVKDRAEYWHVPSKADWDKLLNSIEPCEYRNHHSAQCHVELGKVAGKYLKSECGWVGQEECTCDGTKPYTGGSSVSTVAIDESGDEYIHDGGDVTPSENPINENTSGVDKYGMRILASGVAHYKNGAKYEGITETAAFWTTTEIAQGQDTYVKVFDYDKGGVWQVAECPSPYFSVRLVKNYNGSNYRSAEYIDGVLYKAILFPESGQVWLASNFADKRGFITLNDVGEIPEVLPVDGGHVLETRTEMFINEFNGRYWEKKVMNEGDTIVIEYPHREPTSGITKEICWIDEFGNEHCTEIEIPNSLQRNNEYRVFTIDDGCDKDLANTDDLVLERVIDIIAPLVEREKFEREEADAVLQDEIDNLRETMESGFAEVWEAIDEEVSARTEADAALDEKIDAVSAASEAADAELWEAVDELFSGFSELSEALESEIERAISAETALDNKIDAETNRAIAREDEIEEELLEEIDRAKATEAEISGLTVDTTIDYNLNVSSLIDENGRVVYDESGYNLILKSKDENPNHFIKIKLNSNFGEI